MISIMGCPLKDLDTSALSASPRRLIEGVLEVEGPTSADAGVASCLLFNAEPVFRRLRDDLFDGKILVGMIRRGGIELQKGSVGMLWKMRSFRGADSKLELYARKAEGQLEQSDNSSTARLPGGHSRHENETQEILNSKRLLATATERIDLHIYIVGAGA